MGNNANYEITEASRPEPLTKQVTKSRFGFLRAVVNHTADSVRNMPMLIEPKFDIDLLSNANPISKVVYVWVYMFKKLVMSQSLVRRMRGNALGMSEDTVSNGIWERDLRPKSA